MEDVLPWLFAAWMALIVAFNIWLFWRMAARLRAGNPLFSVPADPTIPARSLDAEASTYRVGAWVNGFSATATCFKLSFDDHGLELRGGLSGLISVSRSEVTSVEPIRGLTGKGFQLNTPTGRLDRVAVFALGGTALRDLDSRGWPVLHQRPRRIVRQMSQI